MQNQDENSDRKQKIDNIQAASTSPAAVNANKPDRASVASSKEGFSRGQPVKDFPIEFEWQSGDWELLFDRQTTLIKEDLRRAHADSRIIVYLSCAISSVGGGHFSTNVDIVGAVERNLMAKWGERFFILNPTKYQMESKEGTGLILQHAEAIYRETGRKIDLEAMVKKCPPTGGDYMRMWTKIMVEDEYYKGANTIVPNCGNIIDVVYCIGPADVQEFFLSEARSLSQAVEIYFARKYTIDSDFRRDFDCMEPEGICRPLNLDIPVEKDIWRQRRLDFFKYYATKASTNFSLGCHDEWNIACLLNDKRRTHADVYGIASQIPVYFDGRQVNAGDYMTPTAKGYAL